MLEVAELACPQDVVDLPHVLVDALPVAQLGVADLAGELLAVRFVPPCLVLAQALQTINRCFFNSKERNKSD